MSKQQQNFLTMTSLTSSSSVFGGQSLTDRVNAARYALSGQGLARSVCKATTEEMLPPKKKHLDYLIQCTHEANVSMPCLGNLLLERALSPTSSWVVVFKALMTMHHLMCHGNERFSAFLASAPSDSALKQLSVSFADDSIGGREMAPFVRRYASYVLARILSYRLQGYDFAKVRRGVTSEQPTPHPQAAFKAPVSVSLRDLALPEVLVVLPRLQTQVDSLLDFGAKESDLKNAVIRAAFLLLFRDLVRLFAAFNDCIISLLEKFFSIEEVKVARASLDSYVSFTTRLERVSSFLKVAEAMGVEKGDIPDLTRAPYSLLNHLEAHCLVLEGKDPTEVLNRPPPAPPAPPAPTASNPFLQEAPPVVPPASIPPPIPPQPTSSSPFNPFPAGGATAPPPIPPQPTSSSNPFPVESNAPSSSSSSSFNPFM